MQWFEPTSPAVDSSKLALDALRQLVVQQAAFPHRPLPPEREMAAGLGVSRRSVRRALEVLEAEGQVWRRQGKGTFVGPTPPCAAMNVSHFASRTSFAEVMEARLHLEPSLAALAAVRASAEQIAMLRRLTERTRQYQDAEAPDSESLELWDGALHRGIAEAAGNRLLLDIFEMLDAIRRDPLWRGMRQKARSHDRLDGYGHDHEDIVNAIEQRNAQGAAQAMRRHLRTLQSALDNVINADVDGSL